MRSKFWFSTPARAVGPLLACVILLNAIGLALPLTAISLLVVRYVGFEGHPEVRLSPAAFCAARHRGGFGHPTHGQPAAAVCLLICSPPHAARVSPQELNAYYAAKFAPTFTIALFGMLSDSVDLRVGTSSSRQARRGPWMAIGFCGAGLSLVLFALGWVTTPWALYAAGLPGAFCNYIIIQSMASAPSCAPSATITTGPS